MTSRYLNLFLLTVCSITLSFGQDITYSGEFDADSFFTTFEGSWEIVSSENGSTLVFKDDFEAKKAPDLKIFLSSIPFNDINAKNAADPDATVLISLLKKYKGRMEFSIPSTVDLSEFKSLIVHCEKYTKLWGGSSLQ